MADVPKIKIPHVPTEYENANIDPEIVNEINRLNQPGQDRSFHDFIVQILGPGLGIAPDQIDKIYTEMLQQYDDNERFKMTSNQLLNQLIVNDIEIRKLAEDGGVLHQYIHNDQRMTEQWGAFTKSLAELQGRAILMKIRTAGPSCAPVIGDLVNAFTQKIETVNKILKENLQEKNSEETQAGGANNKEYKSKYWKYRFKYELLKTQRSSGL